MRFSELVLAIMKKVDGQRTISSPYHLIKGKKSGQTLQDIGYFDLHPYFSLFPKLDKEAYNRTVARLETDGFLKSGHELICLTEKGAAQEAGHTCLDGWKYRGKEALFLKRLSLAVQTFSHFVQEKKQFDPVESEDGIQRWTKQFLMSISFREPGVYGRFSKEMTDSLEAVKLPDDQKLLVMNRLSGFRVSGLTWNQLAASHNVETLDAQLLGVELLHGWMREIESGAYPLFQRFLEGITEQPVLTESARRTELLFKQGFAITEIAAKRQLKSSTIEDHFVEMAMNDPLFDSRAFIPAPIFERIVTISGSLQTKRLRDIKQQLPEASYFQIRLALAAKEGIK